MKVITVEQRNGNKHDVIVDAEFDHKGTLSITGNGYAVLVVEGKTYLLHRHLMSAKKGETVDHINRDRLDNRKENLRLVDRSQNCQNKISKGYVFHRNKKDSKKYQARIKSQGKFTSLGYYETPEEARAVYIKAHVERFGEYSPYYKGERLNE